MGGNPKSTIRYRSVATNLERYEQDRFLGYASIPLAIVPVLRDFW